MDSTKRDNPEFTSNRVKIVRMLTVCSRKEFSRITGISENTLKLWEEPAKNRHGITQKGALRLIEAVKNLDINCSFEWLMYGVGISPTITRMQKTKGTSKLEEKNWDEEESILKDIEAFKHNNLNAVVVIVTDGSLLPFYQYGDYVGGHKRTGLEIDSLIGSICITELAKGSVIRKIIEKNQDGSYNLLAVNVDKSVLQPYMQNVSLVSAAKIIWHRSRQ